MPRESHKLESRIVPGDRIQFMHRRQPTANQYVIVYVLFVVLAAALVGLFLLVR